jgi:predicted Zn-dependent protease
LKTAPKFALAHLNLGNVLMELDRDRDGVRHYVQAVLASPRSWQMNLALGRALVGQGKLRTGIRYLERAVRLRPGDPTASDALAAAYVAAGRTVDGIRTAKLANRAAKQTRQERLAREIKTRIHVYRRGRVQPTIAGPPAADPDRDAAARASAAP